MLADDVKQTISQAINCSRVDTVMAAAASVHAGCWSMVPQMTSRCSSWWLPCLTRSCCRCADDSSSSSEQQQQALQQFGRKRMHAQYLLHVE
jgi:hypothetical protein